MRTEYILTKVRPIKKLFVIESNDYKAFETLFLEIQDEIDVVQNLIFVNDTDLWTDVNKEFVKRSDPDIILNLSTLDDDRLSRHFGIFSVKPVTDHWKIGRFGTNLFSISKRPPAIERFSDIKNNDITVLSATNLMDTSESLLACINYGLALPSMLPRLKLSIFEKLKPTYLTQKEEMISSIFENDKKFIHLTTELGGFGGSGQGRSIYEVDYNSEGFFNQKKNYFFISDKNDFKTISYFWNTRSYYSYSNIAWIPIEFLKDISPQVNEDSVFVCFDSDIQNKITEQFPSSSIIQPSRLHFSGRNERWTFFEHSQTISIAESEAIIQHPVEKSFSDIGFMGAFVLETRGLKEFIYPKRRSLGKLFFPKHHDHVLFENYFQRISEVGLSNYVLKVSPLKAEDISELIVLPTFNEVIKHLFEDIGYEIESTPKTSILDQTVNLFGGIEALGIIAEKHVFDMIVGLTPNVRTEKILKTLLEGAGDKITSGDILEIIAEIREKGGINFPSVTLTIETILAKTGLGKEEKKKMFPVLQKLYDQRIFLRGKYFQCPSCASYLWIQIDEIKRINYCAECNNLVQLPVYLSDKQDSDYFRLNQLIVRAVDQGQLSTLLLLNVFHKQNYQAFDYKSNLNIYKGGTLITDVDLLIKIGKRIGLAECKSTSGFTEKQVDELINIASAFQCDFIAFSCLANSTSQEILYLIEILNKRQFDFPAFIFTNEVLFNPKPRLITKHFELIHNQTFKKGAILIS